MNKTRLLALTTLLAAPAFATVKWKGDFESGDTSQWAKAHVVSSDRLQVVQSPVRQGHYALKVTGALFHTQGGLKVDSRARVLKRDDTPLPNLLAGGGVARSISGPGPSGYLPGAGLCMAVTLGAVAGRTAALLASGDDIIPA